MNLTKLQFKQFERILAEELNVKKVTGRYRNGLSVYDLKTDTLTVNIGGETYVV